MDSAVFTIAVINGTCICKQWRSACQGYFYYRTIHSWYCYNARYRCIPDIL